MTEQNPDLTNVYMFSRKEGSYPVVIENQNHVADHISINPGTLKVARLRADGLTDEIWNIKDGWLDNQYVN